MKVLLAVILLLSCTVLAQNDAAIAKTKAACGPDNIFFDVKTSDVSNPPAVPPAGKALVFVINQVYTPNNCEGDGCGILARVGLDGSWAGAMYGASYLYMNADPGEHHLCTDWQSVLASRSSHAALTSFTAETGHVYYFRMRLFGDRALIMDLDQINSDEGKYLLASYQESESHARKPRKNHADESD